MAEKIKMQDLTRLHASIRGELTAAFNLALENSNFIQGAAVTRFESEFAKYSGSKHAIGVANGTDALEIGLEALGLKSGDRVIVPSMTFAATAEAVVRQGGIPVFAEVDPVTFCVTAKTLTEAMERAGGKFAGMIVVHLYGKACAMEEIAALAKSKSLFLIEDSAQSHGAYSGSKFAGNFGDLATYSFFPGKNLGALGDAGAITTNTDSLNAKIRMLRDHGRSAKYRHESVGRNSRLDALQASFLSVKLSHLPAWTKSRQKLAAEYSAQLANIPGIIAPKYSAGDSSHVFHQYVIRLKDASKREPFMKHLESAGIETGIHYPHGLHDQPAFAAFVSPKDRQALAFTSELTSQIVSLPMDPLMTSEQVSQVCKTVAQSL